MRRALIPAALAAALAISACGGGGGGETTATEPQTATGPHVSPDALARCLQRHGVQIGPPGSDALLASYGQQAVAAGGATFVIVRPASQLIAFPKAVDLVQAKSELGAAEARGGVRANGLHAETLGNLLIVYFVPTTPESTSTIHGCLPAKPSPLPGFELPYSAPNGSAPPAT